MSLYAALAKHLDAEVASLTYDATGATGNVFIGLMPSTPDVAVGIMPTGGLPQLTKAPTDLPTVQVRVRSTQDDPRTGLELALSILDVLNCLDATTLDPAGADEIFIIGCTAQQSAPVSMGQDSNRRNEWSLNFQTRVHAPSTHRPAVS
jgi:hypothetical protein